MTRLALVAVHHDVESALVRCADGSSSVTVVRRCADLADLLAAAAAGVGDLALVSAGLRGLDRTALGHLADHGVSVVGVTRAGDEAEERSLRQLGIQAVVRSDDDAADLDVVVGSVPEPVARCDVSPDGPEPLGAVRRAAAGSRSASGSPAEALGAARDSHGDPSATAGPSAARPGRVVAVWGPLGSPGVTTVAVNLAAELAEAGRSVLLVDGNTWGASVAQSLAMVDESPGIAAAARAADHGTLDRVVLARLAPVVRPGLRVLTGLPRPDRWPELRAASVEEVLRHGRTIADIVLVDLGFSLEDDEELSYDTSAPRRNAVAHTTLETAAEVVVVGAADPVGLQRLVRGVQELAVTQAPAPTVVVNKVRASAVGPRPERAIGEALERFSGLTDLTFLPWAPDVCDAAMLAGDVLAAKAPRSPLRLALSGLAGRFAQVPSDAVTGRGA